MRKDQVGVSLNISHQVSVSRRRNVHKKPDPDPEQKLTLSEVAQRCSETINSLLSTRDDERRVEDSDANNPPHSTKWI